MSTHILWCPVSLQSSSYKTSRSSCLGRLIRVGVKILGTLYLRVRLRMQHGNDLLRAFLWVAHVAETVPIEVWMLPVLCRTSESNFGHGIGKCLHPCHTVYQTFVCSTQFAMAFLLTIFSCIPCFSDSRCLYFQAACHMSFTCTRQLPERPQRMLSRMLPWNGASRVNACKLIFMTIYSPHIL